MAEIKYIRDISELFGWVIVDIKLFDNAELIIKLADDSIAIFDLDYGRYVDDPGLQLSAAAKLDEYQMYHFGFMKKWEYDKFKDEKQRKMQEIWKEQRRNQYETLKKEFGDG